MKRLTSGKEGEKMICPICKKEHISGCEVCDCGFEGFVTNEEQQLHKIYKYTKNVYNKKIDFPKNELIVIENSDRIEVDAITTKLGLAVVDLDTEKYTIASNGMLAFNRSVISLIVNTNEIMEKVLDESVVRILFLGKNVQRFSNDFIMQLSSLRYIYVDDENESFVCDNHVLFNQSKDTLYMYASLKEEKEYRVDKDVKRIQSFAFHYPKHLRTLYLPKGVYLESNAILVDEEVRVLYY